MKRIVKNGNILEEFKNFEELLSVCDARVRNFSDGCGGREGTDDDWCGAEYSEAREWLIKGYNKDFGKFMKGATSNITKMQAKKSYRDYNNVVGFTPNVANAVMGLPNAMVDRKTIHKKSKVVSILVDASVYCGVTSSEYAEFGAKLVNQVIALERQGYRVKIDLVDGFCARDKSEKCSIFRVPVKREGQPANVKRIAFPLGCVAFSRRLGFDWYERCPDAMRLSGYGCPVHSSKVGKALVEDVFGANENIYIVNYGCDLDMVFKNIK